jgi:hypothetical protein
VIETESNILARPKVTKELEIFLGDLKDMRNTLSRYFPTTRIYRWSHVTLPLLFDLAIIVLQQVRGLWSDSVQIEVTCDVSEVLV